MNRVARKGFLTVMVAGGVLASTGWAQADGSAGGDNSGSPGILSGNTVGVPVHIPVTVCGNSADVAGLLNPAPGNACANTVHHTEPPAPPVPSPPSHQPVPAPPNEPSPVPALAHTGSGGAGWAAGAGAALVLGGGLLYRRARAAAAR